MQNARVGNPISAEYSGLSSLVKPGTVRRALCSYEKNGFIACKTI
jgi:hypothetical protein